MLLEPAFVDLHGERPGSPELDAVRGALFEGHEDVPPGGLALSSGQFYSQDLSDEFVSRPRSPRLPTQHATL